MGDLLYSGRFQDKRPIIAHAGLLQSQSEFYFELNLEALLCLDLTWCGLRATPSKNFVHIDILHASWPLAQSSPAMFVHKFDCASQMICESHLGNVPSKTHQFVATWFDPSKVCSNEYIHTTCLSIFSHMREHIKSTNNADTGISTACI